ncbi:hypothetical protein PALB_21440 [Pseudoalteromonas luteoviolacea B = ATCC 29581]|nr:hypothetical protein PALB_21440 [Pseudoalteromonas luteoviolacea B = ATCC 29581]
MLAQLGEHRPYKARVTGSSPVQPTTFFCGSIAAFFKQKAWVTGFTPVQPTTFSVVVKHQK